MGVETFCMMASAKNLENALEVHKEIAQNEAQHQIPNAERLQLLMQDVLTCPLTLNNQRKMGPREAAKIAARKSLKITFKILMKLIKRSAAAHQKLHAALLELSVRRVKNMKVTKMTK